MFESVLAEAFKALPHPVLPQMSKSTEFGEGEQNAGMNIFINAQVEIILPPFSARLSRRSLSGLVFAGCKWGKVEGGRYAAQSKKYS